MNSFPSPISYMHACVYLVMVLPLIVFNKNSRLQKTVCNTIKMILYVSIWVAIFIPISIEEFGYSDPKLFIIWVISSVCTTIAYWIAIYFVYKKRLSACVLDVISSVFFCISGLVMGNAPLLHCYWTLVISAASLFALSVIQFVSHRI